MDRRKARTASLPAAIAAASRTPPEGSACGPRASPSSLAMENWRSAGRAILWLQVGVRSAKSAIRLALWTPALVINCASLHGCGPRCSDARSCRRQAPYPVKHKAQLRGARPRPPAKNHHTKMGADLSHQLEAGNGGRSRSLHHRLASILPGRGLQRSRRTSPSAGPRARRSGMCRSIIRACSSEATVVVRCDGMHQMPRP